MYDLVYNFTSFLDISKNYHFVRFSLQKTIISLDFRSKNYHFVLKIICLVDIFCFFRFTYFSPLGHIVIEFSTFP
ncbi:hypothetical protein [Capybara microvirus Cap3_SP_320]|nr:hypothetical protein [Capybara microvirus Cap3_SP_320]